MRGVRKGFLSKNSQELRKITTRPPSPSGVALESLGWWTLCPYSFLRELPLKVNAQQFQAHFKIFQEEEEGNASRKVGTAHPFYTWASMGLARVSEAEGGAAPQQRTISRST